MVNKIIVVDFSGTLIKSFVVEQANLKRYSILGIQEPSEQEHKKLHGTKKHYDIIKQHIATKYGLEDDMRIGFIQNYDGEISLTGKDVKTIIMTDLFRDCMYLVAKEHGLQIYTDNSFWNQKGYNYRGFSNNKMPNLF